MVTLKEMIRKVKSESQRQFIRFSGRLIATALALVVLAWFSETWWGKVGRNAVVVGILASTIASLVAGQIIARAEGRAQADRINGVLLWVGGRFGLAVGATLVVVLFGFFDFKALLLGVAASHLIFLGVEMPYALRLSGPLSKEGDEREGNS